MDNEEVVFERFLPFIHFQIFHLNHNEHEGRDGIESILSVSILNVLFHEFVCLLSCVFTPYQTVEKFYEVHGENLLVFTTHLIYSEVYGWAIQDGG